MTATLLFANLRVTSDQYLPNLIFGSMLYLPNLEKHDDAIFSILVMRSFVSLMAITMTNSDKKTN
jgi:hypothetical protein